MGGALVIASPRAVDTTTAAHWPCTSQVSCAAGLVTAVPPASCGGVPGCFEVADAKSTILLKVPLGRRWCHVMHTGPSLTH